MALGDLGNATMAMGKATVAMGKITLARTLARIAFTVFAISDAELNFVTLRNPVQIHNWFGLDLFGIILWCLT